MVNIIRIIPKMKLGGVERGLLNEIKVVNKRKDINYHVFFIEQSDVKIKNSNNVSINNMNFKFYNIISIRRVIDKYIKENCLENVVFLSSLWKSHLISFLFPRINRISFFHSASYSHILDVIISKIAFKVSQYSIYDSYSTRDLYSNNGYVVPYIFKITSESITKKGDLSFVFIGRINKVKGLDRALLIISKLKEMNFEPVFDIYGPDEGERKKLEILILQLGISTNVNFKGVIEPDYVPSCLLNYTFYIQTSHREGMGASIILAQSIGLIPIVTPVGEISRYCNQENSIIIEKFDLSSIDNTASKILKLLDNKILLSDVRNNAKNVSSHYNFFEDAISDVFNFIEKIPNDKK